MDRKNEFRLRRETAHTPHVKIYIVPPFPVRIIAGHIQGRPVIFVLSAPEKLQDLRHVVEPLVVVQKKKPFPSGMFNTHISGSGKIVAPGKGNDLGGVLLRQFPHPLVLSRKYQDQLAVQLPQQGLYGMQASAQRFQPVRYQQRYGKLYIHHPPLLFSLLYGNPVADGFPTYDGIQKKGEASLIRSLPSFEHSISHITCAQLTATTAVRSAVPDWPEPA